MSFFTDLQPLAIYLGSIELVKIGLVLSAILARLLLQLLSNLTKCPKAHTISEGNPEAETSQSDDTDGEDKKGGERRSLLDIMKGFTISVITSGILWPWVNGCMVESLWESNKAKAKRIERLKGLLEGATLVYTLKKEDLGKDVGSRSGKGWLEKLEGRVDG